MTTSRRRFLHLAAAVAASPVLLRAAGAQAYPSRSVRILVATSAGGTTDLAARLIAQWLTDKLGQAFVVENRPGGGNNIGTEAAVRSPPDGYTLFMANSVNAINTTMYPNLPFNFATDMVPVAIAMRSTLAMQVHPSVPVRTVPEFIAYAKARPGAVNMGSGGKGSTGHVSGELFQMMAGIKLTHVPYRGEAMAMTDLLGGQVHVVFATLGSSMQYIKTDKVRALAVTSTGRSEALPGLPPIADFLPDYESSSWSGLCAPKNTPADIIDKLNKEINAGLADPRMKARFVELGNPPSIGSPAEFGRIIVGDTEKWARVIKSAGVKTE